MPALGRIAKPDVAREGRLDMLLSLWLPRSECALFHQMRQHDAD